MKWTIPKLAGCYKIHAFAILLCSVKYEWFGELLLTTSDGLTCPRTESEGRVGEQRTEYEKRVQEVSARRE